ncbi:MAG: hypothetical protein CMQ14_08855 [Gammaproteobacteria bacterium]|nr:hypothetical protein [Gammaproteobacteria bacterium]|tara:strand:- start:338 stop:1030 length:693 start_codon:yes stop_codon:yes gene_type:complete
MRRLLPFPGLILLFCLLLLLSQLVQAQGNRPPGYSGNLEEQTAQMQAKVRYGSFIDSLEVSTERRAEIDSAIIAVFIERARASRDRSSGRASSVDLEEITSATYLREQLAAIMNAEEVASFDHYEATFQQRQLRYNFTLQLSRVAGGLTEANREIVLEVLMHHMGADQEQVQTANRDAVDESQRQLQALMNARMEIAGQLDDAQLQEAEKFLGQILSGLLTAQSMNETEQ